MPESEPIMNAVLRIFQENKDVEHVQVQGHTDTFWSGEAAVAVEEPGASPHQRRF